MDSSETASASRGDVPGSIAELIATFPRDGRVQWIGLRPARREPMIVVDAVEAIVDRGLMGDRSAQRARHNRQLTFIQVEHLDVVARMLERAAISPELLRRNVAVRGINLSALHNQVFQIGTALFEGTGFCHPCSRMEEVLGNGGYNAMRGHGGITARVLRSGTIRVSDAVQHCGKTGQPGQPGTDHV